MTYVTFMGQNMQEISKNIRQIVKTIEDQLGISKPLFDTNYTFSPQNQISIQDLEFLKSNPSALSKYIDHTALKATTTTEDIQNLCQEAQTYEFCSICIPSGFVQEAHRYFKNSSSSYIPKTCVVVGFPLGNSESVIKCKEIEHCIELGVDEIDFVMNVGWLLQKRYDLILNEFQMIRNTSQDKIIKVILETCYLNFDQIVVACIIARLAKLDFVKTSTGFGTGGAQIDDVALMHRLFGDVGEVKASGGIRNVDDALRFLQSGATRLGCSKGVSIVTGRPSIDSTSY